MSESQRSRPKRSLARRLLTVIAGLLVVLIIFVALLPTLITMGLGHGLIRDKIQEQVTGDVDFDSVQVSWLGSIGVTGLTITEPGGRKAVDITVGVDRNLLDLIRGNLDGVVVDLGGKLDGEVREDGSISFADLAKPSDEPTSDEPLPDLSATLNIAGVDLRLHDASTARDVVFTNLAGTLAYAPGAVNSVELKGAVTSDTPSGVANGEITISGSVDGLISSAGVLTLGSASVDLSAGIRELGIPRVPRLDRIETLDLTVRSSDVTDRITTTVNMASILEGGHRSTLTAELAAIAPVTADGAVQLGPESITGTVTGESVPTGLIQQFLNDTPIVATRDLGETMSIEATFSEGEQRDVELTARSDVVDLTVSATVDATTRELRGDRVTFSGRVHPDVLDAYTPISSEDAVAVSLEMTELYVPGAADDGAIDLGAMVAIGELSIADADFTVTTDTGTVAGRLGVELSFNKTSSHHANAEPMWMGSLTAAGVLRSIAPDLIGGMSIDAPISVDVKLPSIGMGAFEPGTELPLDSLAVSGEVTIEGPTTLSLGNDETDTPPIEFQYTHFTLDSDALASGLRVNGSATVAGGTITFDEDIRGLVDDQGMLTPASIAPIGTLRVVGIDPEFVAAFAGEQGDLVRAAAVGPIAMLVETSGTAEDLSAEVEVTSGETTLTSSAGIRPDLINLRDSVIDVVITPELAALVQGETPAVRLTEAARVRVDVEPIKINRAAEDGANPLLGDLAATVTSERVTAQLTETIIAVARNLNADVKASSDLTRLDVDASTRIAAPRGGAVGWIDLDMGLTQREETWSPDGTVVVRDLNVQTAERMLGQEAGTLSDWTGREGDVRVTVSSEGDRLSAVIKTELERVSGTIMAALRDEVVSLESERLDTTLSAEVLQQMFAAAPADDADTTGEPPALRVTNDVPVSLILGEVNIPMGLLNGESFDPAAARLDLTGSAQQIDLIGPDGSRTRLADLDLRIEAADFTTPIEFSVLGSAIPQGPGASGRETPISITGTLADVMDENSVFSPADGRLEADANLTDVPTAIADAMLNLEGMLVAAVGPQMEATFKARDFSPTSGTLITNIKTTNGWLKGRVRGRENAIKIVAEKPILASLELTEPFRERLLKKIHPIFADVRTIDSPLELMLDDASIPFDGDVSQLSGIFEITVGDLQIDKGSLLVALLSVTRASDSATITGSIEPIRGQVQNGIVTYERFALTIDRHRMLYAGQIDLNTRTVALRTELPLESLAMSVKELRGFADKIVVPIVTSGSLDAPETKIDPSFNLAEAAARAGFEGVLGDIFGDQGLGGILDDIFKR